MDKKALVERCQQGDREALGILYSTYSARMIRIIRHYIADPADANDILHDGFIVAFTQIAALRDPEKIESWLGTIMRNLSIQYLNQTEIFSLLDENSDMEDTPDIQDLISIEELEAIINRLPEGYRKVFKLAVLENKSHAEIGKLLGIAPHTSSSQLFRAKEMLRRIIREHRMELAGSITILLALLALIPQLFNYRLPDLPPEAMNYADGTLTIGIPTQSEEIAEEPAVTTQSLIAAASQSSYTTTKSGNNAADAELTADNDVTNSKVISNTDKSTNNSADNNANNVEINADSNVNSDDMPIATESRSNKVSKSAVSNEPKPQRERKSIDDYSKANEYITFAPRRKSIFGIGFHANTSGTGLNSTMKDVDNLGSTIMPGPDHGEEEKKPESRRSMSRSTASDEPVEINHDFTLTVGATFSVNFTRTLSLETGIRYSYLRSKAEYTFRVDEYRSHYIGVPLKLNLSLYTNSRFNVYGTAGAAVDFPINATKESSGNRTDITAPTQWSLLGGVGLQYRFTPKVSLFVEPSFRYNFHNSGSQLINKWQDDRYEFTLPIGLRLNW